MTTSGSLPERGLRSGPSGRWSQCLDRGLALPAALSVAVVLGLMAGPALGQDADFPDFAQCMNREVARFEQALRMHETGPSPEMFSLGSEVRADLCTSIAILLCDWTEDVQTCQVALADQQEQFRQDVLVSLPEPETVAKSDAPSARELYPVLHALAHGSSAGPDCDGHLPVLESWCQAREAGRRVAIAFLTWQLARFLDVTPRATEIGWAELPRPTRPVARPEGFGP